MQKKTKHQQTSADSPAKPVEIVEDESTAGRVDPVPKADQNENSAAQVEISQEELEQVIASVSDLMKEKEELENKYLLLQADFDNFRRRMRQEKEDTRLFANQELLCNLLPVIDNFSRALTASKQKDPFQEGVEMIYRQLTMVAEQAGLEEIEAVGKPFDPNLHEAVLQKEVEEEQKGLVLMETQKGYTLNGRLLRATMVQVGV
ncbi:MAG: nucleotide exchange factor GrpE [Bacillota bacterium]|jgi:molecular chaperone GrpE